MTRKHVSIIKPNYALRAKVGVGKINPDLIKKCQTVLDHNNFDFIPLAEGILDRLQSVLEKAATKEISSEETLIRMTDCIMQIKANAGIFKFDLAGKLAGIVLSFLETIRDVDADVLEIVAAHHKILNMIVKGKVRGDGGAAGIKLEEEIRSACQRYFKKTIKNTAS